MVKTWHLKLDHTMLALAILQRSAIRRLDLAYSQLIDYDLAIMRPHLPHRVERILDIGSGLAAIDVRLHWIYPDAHIYLLDQTGLNVEYGIETEQVFYNSQAVALRLLRDNGVLLDRVHLLEATPDYEIDVGGVDLALSLFSWGWHYPLGTYAEAVAGAVISGGTLIMDVRNREGEDLLLEAFDLEAMVELQDGKRCFWRRRTQ